MNSLVTLQGRERGCAPFEMSSSEPSPRSSSTEDAISTSVAAHAASRTTLALLAHQLGQVPNFISVEGHTDARAYADVNGYGNWELSADRANAARRLMEHAGLRSGQISQVRGFADRQLRVPSDPLDPSNRRISVIVHYLTQNPAQSSPPDDEDSTTVAPEGGDDSGPASSDHVASGRA